MLLNRLLLVLAVLVTATTLAAKDFKLKLGMTTSMDNAGIAELLKEHHDLSTEGVDLKVIVAGTGKIIGFLQSNDLDMAIVHNKDRELNFLNNNPGERIELFSNDFVLVGPKDDPAKVLASETMLEAIELIIATEHIFISRGDDSGTHIVERDLWISSELNFSQSPFYLETGAGSGQSLNIAAAMGAYMFVDSSTFFLFNNKRDLTILKTYEYPNIYSLIIPTSNLKHETLAKVLDFKQWILSEPTKELFDALDESLIRYIADTQ